MAAVPTSRSIDCDDAAEEAFTTIVDRQLASTVLTFTAVCCSFEVTASTFVLCAIYSDVARLTLYLENGR